MESPKDELRNKRIAGIDYGSKRIGIALCDPMHIIASPYQTILNTGANTIDAICKILANENVGGVVVGVPYNSGFGASETLSAAESFIEVLRTTCTIPVYPQDETLTSQRAEKIIRENHKKKSRQSKQTVDQIAAALILEDFIREQNL